MCGINGIFAYQRAANPIDEAELMRTRDHMAARGPDGKGSWISSNNRVGFGHRRLSIIDLSDAGAQPMSNADNSLIVTFNGEIYNYREIRRELESKGYVFRTNSDTEVLLHLYSCKSSEMVHDLRGMFAFAIWDTLRHELFLARDPYGIKPLYYADNGSTIRFGSQVKALMAGGGISRDPEPAGWVGYYLFGNVPEPFTTFREVRALPAGSWMRVNETGKHEPKHFFSIAEAYANSANPYDYIKDVTLNSLLRESLLDSVKYHLIADVPVGAFLSAGVDSGALVGLMRDAGQSHITTVTIAFDEFKGQQNDESPLAAEVASQYGAEHHTRVVTEKEFHEDLPRILQAMDQPSIDGLNTWFVSKASREFGLKVAVSGLGGDELFGGYPSFTDIPRWRQLFALPSLLPFLGDSVRVGIMAANRIMPRLNPKTAGLMKYGGTYAGGYLLRRGLFMPWELSSVMDPDMAEIGLRRLNPLGHINSTLQPIPRGNFASIAVLEASLYMRNQLLRDTDWASMAHSLEVRVPLVDSVLLKALNPACNNFYGSAGKKLLAKSPSTPLPDRVLERPKTGFTTPIAHWLQNDNRIKSWKNRSALSTSGCPWARRWAYSVAQSINNFGA